MVRKAARYRYRVDGDERTGRFRAKFDQLVAFESDRAIGADLQPEAMTVVRAIAEAIESGSLPAIHSPALREALTLTSLLGRRAGLLDASAAAALALAPAILDAVDVDPTDHVDPFRTAAIDGYVRAGEERMQLVAARRVAAAIPVVELAAGCVAIFLRGEQDADELERVIEDLGRTLLARNARACIVDAAGLRRPDRDRAGQLFAVHATCVMLGVKCVYAGVASQWREIAEERGTDLSDVHFADDFRSAFDLALAACDLEIRGPRAGFRRVLGRLVGR